MVDISTNPLYYAAAGGLILGLATSLNYCLRGKVTGMSGIVYNLSVCNKSTILCYAGQLPEKLSIVGGMLVAAGIFFDIFGYGTYNGFTPFGPEYQIVDYTSYVGYAIGGLLVGFGTKLGNGCTSGHGLCGLPRFSIRSIVAVITFLFTAIAIATLNSYETLGPLTDQNLNPQLTYDHWYSANIGIIFGVIMPIAGFIVQKKLPDNAMESKAIGTDQIITWIVGLLFGCGLLVSGMVRRVNILGFLAMHEGWNPSLLFVLGCGVGVNLITFNYMLRVKKQSFLGYKLFNPANNAIDWKLVTGAFCFGLGWGISGLCPGPAIVQFSVFTLQIQVVWFGSLIIGQQLASLLDNYTQNKNAKQMIQNNSSVDNSKKVQFKNIDTDSPRGNSPQLNESLVV